MGFRDLVLFYVVTGVSLRWIAAAASIGPGSILIWIGAWLLFYVPLALSVIELSSRYPAEGGLYVWTKKAFGEGPSFIAAWTYWNSNLPYFPAVLYFAASNILFLRPIWRLEILRKRWPTRSRSAHPESESVPGMGGGVRKKG
jgi:glutamate:GABA antiporter